MTQRTMISLAVFVLVLGGVAAIARGQCGTFANHVTYGAGNGPQSVATGDLDGDADLDLAVANYYYYGTVVSLREQRTRNVCRRCHLPRGPSSAVRCDGRSGR